MGFLSKLLNRQSSQQSQATSTEGVGFIVKGVFPITQNGNGASIKALLEHGNDTPNGRAIPDNFEPMTSLIGSQPSFFQAQKDGNTYLSLQTREDFFRISAWVLNDGQQGATPTAVIIREKKGEDGLFRITSILASKPMMFAVVLEPPCCNGSNSAVIYYKQQGELQHRIIQSEKALQQGVLDDFRRRGVVIGNIKENDVDGALMVRETLNHLLGNPCECKDNRFGRAYREPS